jgi:hypothetical protein
VDARYRRSVRGAFYSDHRSRHLAPSPPASQEATATHPRTVDPEEDLPLGGGEERKGIPMIGYHDVTSEQCGAASLSQCERLVVPWLTGVDAHE